MRVRRIPEQVVPGRRLGRHVRHDPRSLAYLVAEADPATLTSVRHVRHIPVLDQGDLGSCTGNAAEGCLGTSPFYETLDASTEWVQVDPGLDEEHAKTLYSAATKLDDYPGQWPTDDTGSSGLAVAKACQQAGLISGYRHATSLNAALTALAVQPVIIGIPWYSSFDEVPQNAELLITSDAYIRGGHEVVLDQLNTDEHLVGFTNSWGESWGEDGRAYFSWATLARLLSEDGDVTVFVPLSEPAPTPAPPKPQSPPWVRRMRKIIHDIEDWLESLGY